MKLCRLLLFLAIVPLACAAASDDPTITLVYNNYPPYKVRISEQKAAGLVLAPLEEAFTKAGVPFVWREMPHARQIAMIKYNSSKVCAVGLYKTKERGTFGKFTDPIYKGGPFVIVTNRENDNVENRTSLSELFANKINWVVLVHSKSYGGELDALIKNGGAAVSYADDDLMILNMLEHNHGQYTLFEYDKINFLKKMGVWDEKKLFAYNPKDAPTGEFWYAICSKKVDDSVLVKINKFLSVK